MSDLEKYLLANRDELDRMEAVPEEALWQKIRAETATQKPPARIGFNWKLLSIAALVLALAGWGLLFFLKDEAEPPAPLQRPVPKPSQPIAEQKEQPVQEPLVAEQQTATVQTAKAPVAAQKKPQKRQPKADAAPQPELSEDERRLQQLVAQKQQEIGLDTIDRATYASLLKELDELEISVQEARRDLGSGPQRERLMETLIRYYELKIRILEQINYEINKNDYHEALEKRI
ncbi:MAG: hypothetical protein IT258_14335 [Saprospiraceae bacterium]|nr:hypothetical protein [Saprospiraceae bacterium]